MDRVVASVLCRLSGVLLQLAIAAIPAFIAYKLIGPFHEPAAPWLGCLVWVVGIWVLTVRTVEHVRKEEEVESLAEFFTAADPDAYGTPPLVPLGAGLAFAGFGIVAWMSDVTAGEGPDRPTPVDQLFFSALFLASGSGLLGFGLSILLARRPARRQLRRINRQIRSRPDDPDGYVERGCFLLDRCETEQALESFSRAIELDPNHVEALLRRAEAYWYLDQYDSGLDDANRVIEIDPRNDEAYEQRGLIHQSAGHQDLAEADFAKSEELIDDGD